MFSIEKQPSMCPMKRVLNFSFLDTLFYVIVIGFVVYYLSGFFEDYCPFKKIDKCPLASNRDQKISILENKLDKILNELDHIWEIINDTESEASDNKSEASEEEEDLIPEDMIFHMKHEIEQKESEPKDEPENK